MTDYSPDNRQVHREESGKIWGRIHVAERAAEEHLKKCQRALDLYLMKMRGEGRRAYLPRLQVPYIIHAVETIAGAVTENEAKLDLIPRNAIGVENKDRALAALNYEFASANPFPEFEGAVKDLLFYSYAVIYDGWVLRTKEQTTYHGRPAELNPTDPTPDQFPLDPLDSPPLEDHFFVRRISPKQFFISPEATRRVQEAQYMGFWEWVPLDDLKANADLDQNAVGKLQGATTNLQAWLPNKPAHEYPDDLKRVKCYHYFERRRQLYCIYAEGCETPLLLRPWNWESGRYPFRVMFGLGDEDCFFGLPHVLAVEDVQRELNEIRSQASLHRRLAVPKTFIKGTAPTPKQMEDLMNPLPFGFVYLEDAQNIDVAQPPVLYPAMYQMDQWAKGDMQVILGQNQFEFLTPGTHRKTAVEAQAIDQGGAVRANRMIRAYERLIAEVAQDCFDLILQWSGKEPRLFGKRDAGGVPTDFGHYTRPEIEGQFHFKVVAGSTAINFNAQRLEALSYYLQTAGQVGAQAESLTVLGMDLKGLLRAVSRFIPELQDSLAEIFPPGPTPEEMAAVEAAALPALPSPPPDPNAPPSLEAVLSALPIAGSLPPDEIPLEEGSLLDPLGGEYL